MKYWGWERKRSRLNMSIWTDKQPVIVQRESLEHLDTWPISGHSSDGHDLKQKEEQRSASLADKTGGHSSAKEGPEAWKDRKGVGQVARLGKRRWEEEGSVKLARSWGPSKEPEPLWRPRSWAWVCLPSVPALGFACTILASELEIIHSENKMKIEVSYFLLPQSQLNFQNLIILLHYICYHFDPNVTKRNRT